MSVLFLARKLSFMLLTAGAAFVCLPGSESRTTPFLSQTNIFGRGIQLSRVNGAFGGQDEVVFHGISKDIQIVVQELWKGDIIPIMNEKNNRPNNVTLEGEAKLRYDVPFPERAEYFRREALKGCPHSQHSYALLLWNGFAGVEKDAETSAKFHAAAASQSHLDGMSLLGGCLRTGTGVKRNVGLGLKIIEYCASTGNPTGINKKAALLESNEDDFGAVRLYEGCVKSGRANALLFFNLGWSLVNGQGVDRKDVSRGISLWKKACALAPDEGSEEAAWHLYEECKRDDPKEANKWLDLAIELGYEIGE